MADLTLGRSTLPNESSRQSSGRRKAVRASAAAGQELTSRV
jgi:hypothetical protein